MVIYIKPTVKFEKINYSKWHQWKARKAKKEEKVERGKNLFKYKWKKRKSKKRKWSPYTLEIKFPVTKYTITMLIPTASYCRTRAKRTVQYSHLIDWLIKYYPVQNIFNIDGTGKLNCNQQLNLNRSQIQQILTFNLLDLGPDANDLESKSFTACS